MLTLGSLVLGPLECAQPMWLVLVPVLGVVSFWIARKSLAGLDSAWKWISMTVRLVVILLLAVALAEPSWREEAKDVSVTAIVDVSESIPTSEQTKIQTYFSEVAKNAPDRKTGRLGFISTARESFVSALPSRLVAGMEVQHQGVLDATDLAAGVRLAIATAPRDAGSRFLLVTDGNETSGDLLQAAQAAAALKIPIDVVPIIFEYDGEVMVDKLISPPNAREGETMNVRMVLQASKAARGRINLLLNGQPVDLDPTSDALGAGIELREGQNVLQVPVVAMQSGPQKFEAIFEPETRGGRAVADVLPQNNKSSSVTFVSGAGKVLIISDDPQDSDALLAALTDANIRAEVVSSATAPAGLTELNAYDAIVMVNQSAYNYSQRQQEELRQYVSDTGGGLLMIGGPNAFGAGGWIGSPLEEALPLRLDPPQKRQMPRGALVLTIHSCEIPDGVYYGKKVCEAAINRLSRLDLVGINEFSWQGGNSRWVYPLGPVGDGIAVKRAINSLTFGDMPDFTPSFELSLAALKAADAGQRHMIVISDGDPAPPSVSLLRDYVNARITVTTVGVYPHGGLDTSKMQEISKFTGGRHYEVSSAAGLAKLPEIFIKEAMTVRRSLIYEKSGSGIPPSVLGGASDGLRGVRGIPNINGYVVTAEREGLALVTASVKGSDPATADPLLAQWQFGLGRVVAYTSDASTRWNPQWVGWQGYKQFWEQHLRWVLRPQGSANVRVFTENKGDNTLVSVEAFDTAGEPLPFATFRGRLAGPDGKGSDITLTQVAPGRYQALVPTENSGSYVMSLRYAARDANAANGMLEGAVQAAISRPFADEYRVLKDNRALLTQVAQITGGRVLTGDAGKDLLWDKDGLTMPVAKTPIWLLVATLGLGLFLMDVAVRRVRIDPVLIGNFFRRMLGRSAVVTGQQIGSLKAAREQARQKIAGRAASSGQQLTPEQLEAQAKQEALRATQASKVKFEANPEQLKGLGKDPSAGIAMGGAEVGPQRIVDKTRPTDTSAPKAKAGDVDEGLSRLMKAKKKAREEMDDDGKSSGPSAGSS
jgi:uncharacterized membrane protein